MWSHWLITLGQCWIGEDSGHPCFVPCLSKNALKTYWFYLYQWLLSIFHFLLSMIMPRFKPDYSFPGLLQVTYLDSWVLISPIYLPSNLQCMLLPEVEILIASSEYESLLLRHLLAASWMQSEFESVAFMIWSHITFSFTTSPHSYFMNLWSRCSVLYTPHNSSPLYFNLRCFLW